MATPSRSDLPTSDPTPSPSHLPTSAPTPSPSDLPTSDPTPSPSYLPTSDPTPSPSDLPTSDPTPSPSDLPTFDPSTSIICSDVESKKLCYKYDQQSLWDTMTKSCHGKYEIPACDLAATKFQCNNGINKPCVWSSDRKKCGDSSVCVEYTS